MKPNHLKHLMKKAVHQGVQQEVKNTQNPQNKLSLDLFPFRDHLRPIDPDRTRAVVRNFKKHLEHMRYLKEAHHAGKRTTPGQIEKGPFKIVPQNSAKMASHWKLSNLHRSRDDARKIIKYDHLPKSRS